MARHASQRLAKRRGRFLAIAVTQSNRPECIPGVGAAFSRVQLSFLLERQLAGELVEREVVGALCRQHEAVQQVQPDRVEPSVLLPLRVLRGASWPQFLEGRVE